MRTLAPETVHAEQSELGLCLAYTIGSNGVSIANRTDEFRGEISCKSSPLPFGLLRAENSPKTSARVPPTSPFYAKEFLCTTACLTRLSMKQKYIHKRIRGQVNCESVEAELRTNSETPRARSLS